MKTFIISPALICLTLPLLWTAEMKVPACLQEMIYPVKDRPTWNQYTRIDNYVYQGKMVYLATSNCCDQFNSIYDGECNYICAPSGGIRGDGDGKCKDFRIKATALGTLWMGPTSDK